MCTIHFRHFTPQIPSAILLFSWWKPSFQQLLLYPYFHICLSMANCISWVSTFSTGKRESFRAKKKNLSVVTPPKKKKYPFPISINCWFTLREGMRFHGPFPIHDEMMRGPILWQFYAETSWHVLKTSFYCIAHHPLLLYLFLTSFPQCSLFPGKGARGFTLRAEPFTITFSHYTQHF